MLLRPGQRSGGMLFVVLGLLLGGIDAEAAPPEPPGEVGKAKVGAGRVVGASDEGIKALRTIRVPEGLKAELVAAEPLLANPVAFTIDEAGKIYVAETFRHTDGVTDTRSHMNWLDADLASRSVEERDAMFFKYLSKEVLDGFQVESERVSLLVDTDGDGKMDRSTVFADGFGKLADGIGAGVLARKGDVFYTCIPSLWKLRDTNGDGVADVRTPLQTGYGVHVAFLGHDLHGLRFGPDGLLYFSVGDRGMNVKTPDGKSVIRTDTGVVLRCNPDGTNLEIFATGLRNPQELAFDEFGNLFTGDNNSDSGDKARWVYLVEGSDSGWRIGYQYIEVPNSRGPWNSEKLWYPQFQGQAAYLVPPIANLADGPSGLTYHPGTSRLGESARGKFFMADFRGASGQSGVRSFGVKPKGAGFELVDSKQYVWSILATDVDFGPDGALYISDWVQGWSKPGKGRIYRISETSTVAEAEVREVQTLIREGFDGKSAAELVTLLGHADMRVRQEAQFSLASRANEAIPAFAGALAGDRRMARVHAVWGLGQVGREKPEALKPVVEVLKDADPEIRAQAARVVGDAHLGDATDPLISLLADPSDRVRSLAAIALGKLGGDHRVIAPVLSMLKVNGDKDPVLRHAGVMALAGVSQADALAEAEADPSASARMGVLLSYRRSGNPRIAAFLGDSDLLLVLEAARAINDVPIPGATAPLAALAARPTNFELASRRVVNANLMPITPETDLAREALFRRVVNANLTLGTSEAALALVALAAHIGTPESIRIDAIEALGVWAKPSGRDRVTGLWRPIAERSAEPASKALASSAADLLRDRSSKVVRATAEAIGRLKIRGKSSALASLVTSGKPPAASDEVRATALRALAELDGPDLGAAVAFAVADPSDVVRSEGIALLGRLSPDLAVETLGGVLEGGKTSDKQSAIAALGRLKTPEASKVLSGWLDRWDTGRVPAELELDLADAVKQSGNAALAEALVRIDAKRSKDDPLSAYRECLVGGNSGRGRSIFLQKAEASCLRCHKVEGGGGEVGPNLDGIAKKVDRRHLLEAIVLPNAKIAEGFETLVVALADGQVVTGILRKEDSTTLTLITPEAKLVDIKKADVEERTRGASAMPTDVVTKLSKAEIRDLVEYLGGLK
ncbi:HEAT repeat domain-containing protein [Isosphaeraceae bacterium EP7]